MRSLFSRLVVCLTLKNLLLFLVILLQESTNVFFMLSPKLSSSRPPKQSQSHLVFIREFFSPAHKPDHDRIMCNIILHVCILLSLFGMLALTISPRSNVAGQSIFCFSFRASEAGLFGLKDLLQQNSISRSFSTRNLLKHLSFINKGNFI